MLYGKNKFIETFALMDDGSSVTLIEEDLAKELDIPNAVQDPLCLKWTSDEVRYEYNSKRFDTKISAKNGNHRLSIKNVRTVGQLHLPTQTLDSQQLKDTHDYLRDIPFVSYVSAKPKILIGLDNSSLMLSSKYKSGAIGEPIAIKTPLGWIVYGGNYTEKARVLHVCECKTSEEAELTSLVKQFITLDNIGVMPTYSSKNVTPVEDQRAMDILNKTTVRMNGRYECGLLWKFDSVDLPDSFNMALKRLQCLERKFEREPDLKKVFQEQILSYKEKKYISLLPQSQYNKNSWYLPTFVVKNPNKPGKIRVVWDAAAQVDGVSLNSVLLKGPDLLTNLPGILMRFRERKWGIAGDIREMFHQIKIRKADQQYQLFLWRDNPNEAPQKYVMHVMTFGATCSPAIAQHIKNYNASQFEKSYPKACNAIIKNHYVDDWLESVESEEAGIQLAKEVADIHSYAGFEIRNWISNSSSITKALTHQNAVSKNLDLNTDFLAEKVLGMWWSVAEDTFTYSLRFNKGEASVLNGDKIPTKRQLLRIIMSVYDPLGLLSHFLAYAKILMQMIWRKGISWDDEIPSDLQGFWLEWLKLLPKIETIQIPRYYFKSAIDIDSLNIELHTFVDGSEEAYAAASYLRAESNDGVICTLIGAKSKVAPLKHHSIPRLELLAAVLGVRLATNIQKEHSITFTEKNKF